MTDFIETWAVATLAFAGVALMVIAVALGFEWWADRRRERDVKRRLGSKADETVRFDELFRLEGEPDPSFLGFRLPHFRDLQHLLDQANLSWNAGTFVLITIGAAAIGGTAGLLASGQLWVALMPAMLAGFGPYLLLLRRKRKQAEKFLEHFPDAIELLGRAIRAGHAYSTGLQMVAEESPPCIGREFRRVFEEQKFGLPIEETLLSLADRMEIVEVDIFVTGVLIQRDVGGNLAEILDTLAETIRERFMVERQVRVYTAQGRLTGYLLAGLPLVVGGLILLLNRPYMMILAEETIGRVLVVVAAIMQIIGFLIIRRIVDIRV